MHTFSDGINPTQPLNAVIIDTESTVKQIGKTTTQIFHFVGGEKRTFTRIISSQIKEGEMLKLWLVDGRMLIINKKNLLMTEVLPEREAPVIDGDNS